MNDRLVYTDETSTLYKGDCVGLMAQMPPSSVDAVVTDPPYPEVDREYGRLTEPQWHRLMRDVVREVRRILRPTGSAVFILQPNSEYVGCMRPWLWDFMAWTAREWNQVQDVWWWNFASMPTVHCSRKYGLMRPSLKACVWLGAPDCYRNQDEVLWTQSEANAIADRGDRAIRRSVSGHHKIPGRMAAVADERGGVTPFNVIPVANTDSQTSGGTAGHGAATPLKLCDWWVRYICPPGGVVMDPFAGSATVGQATKAAGRRFVGIELLPKYCEMSARRLAT